MRLLSSTLYTHESIKFGITHISTPPVIKSIKHILFSFLDSYHMEERLEVSKGNAGMSISNGMEINGKTGINEAARGISCLAYHVLGLRKVLRPQYKKETPTKSSIVATDISRGIQEFNQIEFDS